MAIDTIYISTYRNDLPLTRICVASIRYWYADVPIKLIKDTAAGDFNTQEIEDRWNVSVVDTGGRQFGWCFSKLEPLFFESKEKFLILDSDTVFTGPVLDMLASYDAPFVVDDETQSVEEIKRLYQDPQAIEKINHAFRPCGKNFNSGQWVGTSRLVRREQFSDVVEWHNPPRLKHPKMFMPGDQGVLNKVLEKLQKSGRISLARASLMWWAPRDLNDLEVSSMEKNSPYSRIIHWAVCKFYSGQLMPRTNILRFFERYYYSRMRGESIIRRWRSWWHYVEYPNKRISRRLKVSG